MEPEAETTLTEITIQPDGRIYAFGLSREVAEVLEPMCPVEHLLHVVVGSATERIKSESS